MKSYFVSLVIALLALKGFSASAAVEVPQRAVPYVHCNVCAADTCFGIATGDGFSDCRIRRLNDGGIEFVASRDKQSARLHIVVSGGKKQDLPRLESFFANVRACTYQGDNVRCAP
jgi:hypothetical protein